MDKFIEQLKEWMNKWSVSQEFQFGGRWIVHRPGPNRPCKIFFNTKDEAERCIRILKRSVLEK